DSEQHARLLAFEIDEVERTWDRGGVARDLCAPRHRDPGALGDLGIERGTCEKALPGQTVQPDPVILTQIARLTADEYSRADLCHHAERDAGSGFLRPQAGQVGALGIRLVDQVERRDDAVADNLPVRRGNKIDAVL